MTDRGARTLRGGGAAVLAVFVAAFFHAVTGGGAPSGLAVVVSLAFAVPASVALSGRHLSLWRLSTSVVASQLAFHLLFSLGRPSSVRLAAPAGFGTSMLGMPMADMHLTVVEAGGAASAPVILWSVPAMYAGHALAALITVAALRHGERVLLRMARWAIFGLTRLARLRLPAPLVRPRFAPRAVLPAPHRRLAALGVLRHRGPPVSFAL